MRSKKEYMMLIWKNNVVLYSNNRKTIRINKYS